MEQMTREESKLIFGNSHQAEVMVRIASFEGGAFSSKRISDDTSLSPGIVHPIIQRLSRARWLEHIGKVPGERTILYRIRPNPWWDAALQYAHERAASQELVAHERVVEKRVAQLTGPRLAEHSKAMFGNSNMLTVMVFIADHDDDHFTATQITSATGVEPTLVHPLLARLRAGEIIEQVGHVPGERTLLFRRRESPYWASIREIVEAGPTRGDSSSARM